ncbi:MAG: efflux RND transporter periplasmic adaptor subunit [Candidatus Acidiferrales bacterium]|jgi:RND family efflux transporter MFP subunit
MRPAHCYGGGRDLVQVGLAVVCLGGVILSGCSAKQAADQAPRVAVQIAVSKIETIQREIASDAVLYPRNQAAITPRINAPVSKFYVDRGSRVHAGQLLAELENRDLASAAVDNQGVYEQAEATYQSAAQKAQQDVRLAKEQLDAAEKLFHNREFLLQQGAASARDVEDARIAFTQAQNQYEIAQKQYDLKASQGQLASAKAKAEGAQTQLSYTTIVSPISGVVTERPIYPGEMAPSGSPILTVMDLSQVIARAHLSQQDAAQLKVGDQATISVPDHIAVPGKVSLVSPALDPNSTTVEVWVRAANPGEQLRPGANARVAIVAQTVPHALVIPAEALVTNPDGAASVIVLDSANKSHQQSVTIGIRNGNDVQVTQGLQAGEQVVTVGAFELASEDPDVLEKTRIQVETPTAGGDQRP